MAAFPTASPYGRYTIAPSTPVVIYGRRWCGISQMVRRHLDRLGIPYDYVDLDANPDAEGRLSWITGGRVHSPVVYVGGELLIQPTISELRRALARSGVR